MKYPLIDLKFSGRIGAVLLLGLASCSQMGKGVDPIPPPPQVLADSATSAQAEQRTRLLRQRVDSLPASWLSRPGVGEKAQRMTSQLDALRSGLRQRKADPAAAHSTMDWMESWVSFLEKVHPDSLVEEAGDAIGEREIKSTVIVPHWDRPDGCDPRNMEPFDYRMLHFCTDSLVRAGAWADAVALYDFQIRGRNRPVDVAEHTLVLANLQLNQGDPRAASRVLEPFLAYKPTLLDWLDSAARLDVRVQESLRQGATVEQSLALQISNMVAAGAEWEMVRPLVDSLRGQGSDSLTRWAVGQDSIAWKRSLQRGKQRLVELREGVQSRADFQGAQAILVSLRERHPALVVQWRLDDVAAWLTQQQAAVEQAQTPSDPPATLVEARKLLERRQYLEAREKYRSLLGTALRKEAQEDLDLLAEAWCNDRRKEAADKFAASRKAGITVPRATLLLDEAVAALDRCIAEFPHVSFADKVQKNRELLMEKRRQMNPEVKP